ncbi:hypothetical protein Xaut_4940 (plasmid) [Xanthobacter versatilis]|uniref:Uncharacterized protein n=1 Tax=Xanthobacter autotrophicus (strain ATCC BAA-1158 / Py2) TaxID=78245 RepID=A7IQ47_XANP2|nr:hypothetical protein Xaut_4940 [Xanthobacter autotrophicus Py2]
MAAGLWLHLSERHQHQHIHEAIEHEHRHSHDEHDRYELEPGVQPGEPDTHWHQHAPLGHWHLHFPISIIATGTGAKVVRAPWDGSPSRQRPA